MLIKSARLEGKEVIIKFSSLPAVATVIDVDDIGVWIKGLASRLEGAPEPFQSAQQAASKIANPISFIPWSSIQYIVTTGDSSS
jgi:hypothetical protein